MDCNLKEDEIKDDADRYRVISGLTSDFFYCLAVQPGSPMNIVWVDGAYQKLTGYTAEEICNSNDFKAIIHPEDLPRVEAATQSLLRRRRLTAPRSTRPLSMVPGSMKPEKGAAPT